MRAAAARPAAAAAARGAAARAVARAAPETLRRWREALLRVFDADARARGAGGSQWLQGSEAGGEEDVGEGGEDGGPTEAGADARGEPGELAWRVEQAREHLLRLQASPNPPPPFLVLSGHAASLTPY